MAELIKIILAKPDWETKMNDNDIIEKWRVEVAAQGISDSVFNCTLELLKSYNTITKIHYEDDDDTYQWDVRLGVSMQELEWKCECNCSKCVDGHNGGETEDSEEDNDGDEAEVENENEDEAMVLGEDNGDGDNDGDDENDNEKVGEGAMETEEKADEVRTAPEVDWAAEYKKRKHTACICTDEGRIALFQKFVDKFVTSRTFHDMALKRAFLNQLAALEKTITTIDYHPGNKRHSIAVFIIRLSHLIPLPPVLPFFDTSLFLLHSTPLHFHSTDKRVFTLPYHSLPYLALPYFTLPYQIL